jgi:hypothetical protein
MTTSANDAAPDEPTITLLVTEGTPNEGTLTVRVTWEHRDELRELLVGEGLRASNVMEFSSGANLLAILEVGIRPGAVAAAGWALRKPLVRALELFVERQKARKFHVKVGDDVEVSTEGDQPERLRPARRQGCRRGYRAAAAAGCRLGQASGARRTAHRGVGHPRNRVGTHRCSGSCAGWWGTPTCFPSVLSGR